MSDRTPLSLALIEEGSLQLELDDEIADAARRLIDFVKKHGKDAKKAKSEITLKLTLQVENAEEGVYSIKSAVASKVPGRPARVTTAMHEFDKGRPVLTVKSTGSDAGDPRQKNLKFGTE